jgi:hypothetical protein
VLEIGFMSQMMEALEMLGSTCRDVLVALNGLQDLDVKEFILLCLQRIFR